ncbi:Ddt domain-containing protein ptm [Thalictrum thalictroides]|uniref:Ddt domain-containing protein ptm n=1 Tax=Thalictrum thalictroides TaxID=46969 RepID=A0A7J6XCZ6_THATH|nr:Ddt domain-containing protein ptm [Thalictrum thalictroides]
MSFSATFSNNFSPTLNYYTCCDLKCLPITVSSIEVKRRNSSRMSNLQQQTSSVPRLLFQRKQRFVICKVNEKEDEPDNNNEKEKEHLEDGNVSSSSSTDSAMQNNGQLDSQPVIGDQTNEQPEEIGWLEVTDSTDSSSQEIQQDDNLEVASGSPLPGLKQQGEPISIPKETIDILKDQVFGFDTFFVTSQEPYESGVLFKGNLRGKAAKSFEKITRRLKDKFEDQYKLFLLINPEDDKPVAVVVPKRTLQPEATAVPEWFAAGSFGLVTIFTLLLRNVPALQSNLLSAFDNFELLKEGIPGALVTALILGVHELGHILVARNSGIKLGVPYFIPSWQIGSFGAITRIVNIVPNREDLLKLAAAGPLAGFSLGLVLLLLGFILPPSDGIGVVVDASVFHESFLAGGIAKLLLGDALKEGTPLSLNPLVIWAWAGLLINAINSIPAGEVDGGRISFALWGRKASSRLTGAAIALLGLSSLFNDVAFYWVVLIFFLQRGPIAPLSEEITDPDSKYVALGITVLLLGLLVCLPYPFPFTTETEALMNL